ncbi:hypothetical protein [Pontibacter harenae]|uniref:hypothetical protein n=1 Tax=Pontibacter harenae TaxID=2894083 RepID=UPI001E4E2D4B|nr:hypothetical protein [Pontibacter harenae]MCC9168986.1 hypothetical protein [Pontibacter harenae]
MDLQEFNSLALDDRAEAVWRQGTFLGATAQKGYVLSLYGMGGFFCELWYCPASNEIKLALGFTDTSLLEPYLEDIELPGI